MRALGMLILAALPLAGVTGSAGLVEFAIAAERGMEGVERSGATRPAVDEERDPDEPRYAGAFRGVVNGPDGKPLAGARVYLVPSDGAIAPEISSAGPVRGVTDEAGRFEFEAPDATFVDLDSLPARRDGWIIVTADGYGPDFKQYRGRRGAPRLTAAQRIERNRFEFQLAAADVPIRGRLFGPNGVPLVGARVEIYSVTIPRDRDLDAKLTDAKKMRAFLSPPFPGMAMYRADLLPGVVAEARTDDDGRFELTGIGREQTVSLKISGAGVATSYLTSMTRDAADVETGIDPNGVPTGVIYGANFMAMLEPGETVSGRVIDHDTRQPIVGMLVGWGRGFPRDGVADDDVVTDAEGRFQLHGLTPSKRDRFITAASAPGMTYEPGGVKIDGKGPVEIECRRGIPFRLKLVDEAGEPVEARVTYVDLGRNPHAQRPFSSPCRRPYSAAARDAAGIYRGFVIAGPGVILVEMNDGGAYRPASVNPTEFFAAEIAKLAATEQRLAFGTSAVLYSSIGGLNLDNYPAMALVNPEVDSPPLDLTATVVRDVPQRVELVDDAGRLVEGCTTQGMTQHPYDAETPPRSGAFGVRGLQAERERRITFFHEERKLIGFLMARGGSEETLRVRMEPWGTITGRLLDEAGKPVAKTAILAGSQLGETNLDPTAGERGYIHTDTAGRFRIDKIVPGQRYDGRVHRKQVKTEQMAFTGQTLAPGEVRELGDVRLQPVGLARAGGGDHRMAAVVRGWGLGVGWLMARVGW